MISNIIERPDISDDVICQLLKNVKVSDKPSEVVAEFERQYRNHCEIKKTFATSANVYGKHIVF
jgi:hypothetical protein